MGTDEESGSRCNDGTVSRSAEEQDGLSRRLYAAGAAEVVTPNNDTIYGVGFADTRAEPAVIQTPSEVPEGYYSTIQICDAFTTVIRQLGSASATPGGKFPSSVPLGRGNAERL